MQELEIRPCSMNIPQGARSTHEQSSRTSAQTENFGDLQNDAESPRKRSRRISPENPEPPALDVPKKRRPAFTEEVRSKLNSWYRESRHLYPKQMDVYISETGLTKKQLEVWFTNKRKRDPTRDTNSAVPHPSARYASSTQSSGATAATSEHIEASPGSTPSSASRDYHGLSPENSQQERLFRMRWSPQLRQYQDMDCEDEPVRSATAENLSQDDQGPRFIRKNLNSGLTTVDVAQEARPYDASTCNETSGATIFSHTLSANEHQYHHAAENALEEPRPRRKGQRIFARSIPPQRVGDNRFQCQYCNYGFDNDHSWIRHEQNSCGPRQGRYVCMEDGPISYDARGQQHCVFCGEKNPSSDHLEDEHNHLRCWGKPAAQREFNRVDSLIRHHKTVHKATQDVPPSWVKPAEEALNERHWCGFCEKRVGTRGGYYKHVGDHFNDAANFYDMTRWIYEPPDVYGME
jgi:hypothetical protein